MIKQTARNLLVVIGAWSVSALLAWLVGFMLIPLNNRLTFLGDSGTVIMWLWFGFPEALVAATSVIAVLYLIDTRKPLSWVGELAALYQYAGGISAWRQLTRGWRTPPGTADYIGIAAKAIMPTLVCLVVGIWWVKHFTARRQGNA